MSGRKISPFVPVGLIALVAGIFLQHFTHGRYSDFAGGFLMGMALVFLIFGYAQKVKRQGQ
ncbi:MAG: hypothetical protein ABSF72_06510 [Candidatus Sulfotelmatobacter sp.]|jgi:uncharacterized membrane protein